MWVLSRAKARIAITSLSQHYISTVCHKGLAGHILAIFTYQKGDNGCDVFLGIAKTTHGVFTNYFFILVGEVFFPFLDPFGKC